MQQLSTNAYQYLQILPNTTQSLAINTTLHNIALGRAFTREQYKLIIVFFSSNDNANFIIQNHSQLDLLSYFANRWPLSYLNLTKKHGNIHKAPTAQKF